MSGIGNVPAQVTNVLRTKMKNGEEVSRVTVRPMHPLVEDRGDVVCRNVKGPVKRGDIISVPTRLQYYDTKK